MTPLRKPHLRAAPGGALWETRLLLVEPLQVRWERPAVRVRRGTPEGPRLPRAPPESQERQRGRQGTIFNQQEVKAKREKRKKGELPSSFRRPRRFRGGGLLLH